MKILQQALDKEKLDTSLVQFPTSERNIKAAKE
jgi:hypothetical protein